MKFANKTSRPANSKDKSRVSEPGDVTHKTNQLQSTAADSPASLSPSGITQLQKTIGNRAVTQLMKREKAQSLTKQTPVIQGMFTPSYKPITNLAQLNAALANLNPNVAPIAVIDFAAIVGVTGAILDTVIRNSNDSLYDTMTNADVILALTPDLQAATAPPVGYTLETSTGTPITAYVSNPLNHNIGNVAMNHIVEARIHQSSKMRGAPINTPYVHPNDNELYLITHDGTHTDGLNKFTVGKMGHVSAGVHIF